MDLRALLVVRVVVADDSVSDGRRTLYLVEIERRLTARGDEEKFRGLIFELDRRDDSTGQFDGWLGKLRADLVRSRGVFRRELCAACPGRAAPFAYPPARAGAPGEPAVRNAFRKMGVILPA